MKHYGLIGNPLTHSWSQRWFEAMFQRCGITDAQYRLYPLPTVAHLPQWVERQGLMGFNVTLPHKQAVIPQLHALDAEAEAIGAVNCVQVSHRRLVGHNTDAPAFRATLLPLLRPHHTAALILGTGGAARAVAHALRQLGIDHHFVSRQPALHPAALSYAHAARLVGSHLLIVNATPVGMHPHTHLTPWPFAHLLTPAHLCYDLVYNPSPTLFLRQAAAAGARTLGGEPMLQCQAQLSWQIWQSTP